MTTLWAVHISDGILQWPWLVAGLVVAGLLVWLGSRRLRDEEIPRIAVMSSAFFVASSLIHVPIGPGASAHLLLNGLVGIVLGPRAALAIPLGLFLQTALFGHGGFSTLGVNAVVMVVPALLAWQSFRAVQRLPWARQPWLRTATVAGCALIWTLSLIFSVLLLYDNWQSKTATLQVEWAFQGTMHPAMLTSALVAAALAGWAERRAATTAEFPQGLLIGEMTVLATVLLNSLVLLWGGQADWHTLVLIVFVSHLPIAVIESLVMGFTVGFLAKVKPEMLGVAPPAGTTGVTPVPPGELPAAERQAG